MVSTTATEGNDRTLDPLDYSDCASCGKSAYRFGGQSPLHCVTFCDDCWAKMSPFERGLLMTIGAAADHICGRIEEDAGMLGNTIAEAQSK